MKPIALVTSIVDCPNDDDMPLLVEACRMCGISVEVPAWDDRAVDWARYSHAVLRSTWNYTGCRSEFLAWCERVAAVTELVNPLSVARWATDKHYLADLATHRIPIVPSSFVEPGADPFAALKDFLVTNREIEEFVVKPTIGSYSKHVKRYSLSQQPQAGEHVAGLLAAGVGVILQPYLASVDRVGETNLIYFDGVYSHAIRKSALLQSDGTVNGPTADFRAARVADEEERGVASAALEAAAMHLGLERPLLYGRVDLIRDHDGKPQVLELDICEPSLSLPFAKEGAVRFAQVLADQLV